ncbi:MAG: hypothetical protein A2V86_01485 [Deltaproteobacteria bacterium RBG_16_49_23]|nr:MAG: hypothetical protein A2V86_01485 [Deltaproteobacteria bacterium RBG_16_49_23]
MGKPAPPLVEDRFLYAMALPRPRLPLKGKVAAPAGPVSQREERVRTFIGKSVKSRLSWPG